MVRVKRPEDGLPKIPQNHQHVVFQVLAVFAPYFQLVLGGVPGCRGDLERGKVGLKRQKSGIRPVIAAAR